MSLGVTVVRSVSNTGKYVPPLLISAETTAKCLVCNVLGPSNSQRAQLRGFQRQGQRMLIACIAAMLLQSRTEAWQGLWEEKWCISLDQLMHLENILGITRFSQTSEMALDFFSPSCISWFSKRRLSS